MCASVLEPACALPLFFVSQGPRCFQRGIERFKMTWPFAIIALLTITSGIAAMTLRNLVHCALALTVTLAGLAAFYLQLNAQFVGFAQVLVYIGAVAILIVFAILLTRSSEMRNGITPAASSSWLVGIAVALVAFGSLALAVLSSSLLRP